MNCKILLAGTAFVLFAVCANAQGLAGKLRQKAAEAAEKALEKKADKAIKGESDDNDDANSVNDSGNSGNSAGKPSNKKGGGLVSTPPDVNQNLADAESAFKSGSYGDARYAVQQAMLGVELEIGQKVLKSLPDEVSGLKKDEQQDQVTSTGWGWAGLTIRRVYANNEEQQLTATVANNAAWMSSVNAYMSNGGYAQQTGGEQNWKQTKVKGYKAIIEYDENSGYKLSVPLGQSSLIVWEAINFDSEKAVMDAANAFDIDNVKNMLGEK